MPEIIHEARTLLANGTAYPVASADQGRGHDVYLDLAQGASTFGSVSGWTPEQMDAVFADRGGGTDWARQARPVRSPGRGGLCVGVSLSWDDDVLRRRPSRVGIECTAISLKHAIPSTSRAEAPTWCFRTTR